MGTAALLLGAMVLQASEATPGVTIETGDLSTPITQLLAGTDGRIRLRLRGSPRPGFAEWRSSS